MTGEEVDRSRDLRRLVVAGVAIIAVTVGLGALFLQVPSLDAAAAPDVSASTLSVLRPDGAECDWRRVDPVSGLDEVVFRVDGSCADLRVSWSDDGRRAILSVPTATVGSTPPFVFTSHGPYMQRPDEAPISRLIEVSVGDGKARHAPLPQGETTRIAYDAASGNLTAIVRPYETITPFWCRWLCAVEIQGSAETRVLGRYGWRLVADLDDYRALEPPAEPMFRKVPTGSRVLQRHDSPRLVTPHGVEIVLLQAWSEIMTGPVLFSSAGRLVTADRTVRGDLSAEERGFHILVVDWETGERPRMYDVRTGELVYWSDTDHSVSFWPIP